MTTDSSDDAAPALGMVVDEDRGALPYVLIHGESLVACAAWALGEARVSAVDLGTPWAAVVDSGEPFVVHDSLCPMTPAAFIAVCVARTVDTGAVVAGVGDDDQVLSPVVIPASTVAELSSLPSTDLAALVGLLADRFTVERVVAPPSAARVTSLDDVAALELLTTPETA